MERRKQVERNRGLVAVGALLFSFALSACATTPQTALNWPVATYLTVVVRTGDTISQIAERFDVSTHTLVAMNGIDDPNEIRPGEVLRVPAVSHDTRRAVFHEATSAPVYTAPLRPAPTRAVTVVRLDLPPVSETAYQPVTPRPTPRVEPAVQTASSQPVAQPAAQPASQIVQPISGNGEFEWPVTGQIIAAYGSYGNGERNDGINIAAQLGAPIHAAAAGTVTYAGNELKGYGNLVLIRHDDGYVTAYAHAQSISVNRGDHVARGQVIGTAGETGDVASPQVHFEIRRGVQPVDPKPLLMASS